ncbi:MAG: hypothetical protein ABW219_02125 [Ilumatobacteraceae bacterium]
MGSVRSGQVTLHVEETGDGSPIVFVHEVGSDLREWEHQVRWFSRSHCSITYDRDTWPTVAAAIADSEEPAAFNAMIGSFFADVERQGRAR